MLVSAKRGRIDSCLQTIQLLVELTNETISTKGVGIVLSDAHSKCLGFTKMTRGLVQGKASYEQLVTLIQDINA